MESEYPCIPNFVIIKKENVFFPAWPTKKGDKYTDILDIVDTDEEGDEYPDIMDILKLDNLSRRAMNVLI